jgi:hypothetical protein
VGGVVVVSGTNELRAILIAAYEALGLDWNPATVGSVSDEVGETALGAVEDGILAELAKEWELVPGELGQGVLERAAELESGRSPA